MCIFPAAYNNKLFRKHGVTLIELFVVVIIIAIVAGISINIWQAQLEREYADNAKAILKSLLQAEENYFAWKNRYANENEWASLDIANPNNPGNFYIYELLPGSVAPLIIKATRRGKSKGFQIDQEGTITAF